jgi:hypothetical protein
VTTALLDDRSLERLRTALAGYTVDGVHELLGWAGQAALTRGDLAGVARHLPRGDRRSTLVRLFVLGAEVPEADARAALAPLALDEAIAAGLMAASAGSVRALVDIRPYAEQTDPFGARAAGADWWVVSDFGADVRGGPLPADHVLGVGAASLSLAQATPRTPVGRALDIGTGSGVQALHLGGHAGAVVATDISDRALRMAATTAALSGQGWELRRGSLLEPVAGERFDLVVANPPFVVSSGAGGYEYRDSGRAGDEVCAALVRGLPSVLAPGGTGQLLANWIIDGTADWDGRIRGWLDGAGCDAWVWQREVAEPAEYVALWLRDAGETPGTPRWVERYDAWLDWFEAAGVAAIGMGLITLWRSDAADPVIVCEDVPQALEQPIGATLPGWIDRQRRLAATTDAALLDASYHAADDLVLDRADLLGDGGWAPATARLRQSHGMRWSVDVDDAIAGLVAACAAGARPSAAVAVLAATLGTPADEVAAAVAPVLRDLVGRGFLLPGAGR